MIVIKIVRRKLNCFDIAMQGFIGLLEGVEVQFAAYLPCLSIVWVDRQRLIDIPLSVVSKPQRECGTGAATEILHVLRAGKRRRAIKYETAPIFATVSKRGA